MIAYVIERHGDTPGWVPMAATESGDEARRLADLWSDKTRGDGATYRAARYSRTLSARADRGVWLVVLNGGSVMWAGSRAEADDLVAKLPHSLASAFEPSLT